MQLNFRYFLILQAIIQEEDSISLKDLSKRLEEIPEDIQDLGDIPIPDKSFYREIDRMVNAGWITKAQRPRPHVARWVYEVTVTGIGQAIYSQHHQTLKLFWGAPLYEDLLSSH